MTDILVRPQELRQTAQQLRASAKKISGATGGVGKVVLGSALRLVFSGNRAQKLVKRYMSTASDLAQFDNLILYFANQLEDVANRFEQADRMGVAGSKGNFEKGIIPLPRHALTIPPLQYIKFSSMAYSDKPELSQSMKDQGWEVLATAKELGLDKGGYGGVAFINPNTGEVVIAHRGTDGPFSVKDYDDDAAIALGQMPNQYYVSRSFVDEIKSRLDEDERFGNYSLSHTGHSLGAALADLNAMTDNVHAIGFDNPGTLQIIRNNRNIFPEDNRDKLISYQSNPNLVHAGGQNAAHVVQIIPEKSVEVSMAERLLSPQYATLKDVQQTLVHHSLDNMIAGMSEETGFPVGYFPPQTGEANHGIHNLSEYEKGNVKGTANACYLPAELPPL